MSESVVGGRAVLQTIADLGGRILFNLPGRGVYRLLNELPSVRELRYVGGLHEFAVTTMADGYARRTGGPAFLNLYMSTGVLNGASAVFLAQRDRIPLVVTATQTETFAVGSRSRAEASDIVAMMRPITKWAWQVPTPDRLQEALVRATTIAMTPPRGPVFLALPVDYFDADTVYEPVRLTQADRGATVDPNYAREAAEWLAAADLPVLIVGGEAVAAGTAGLVCGVAEKFGAIVLAEPDPPALPVPSSHPLYGGTVDDAAGLLARADTVVHIGVNTYEPWHRDVLHAGCPKRHLWLGTDGTELNRIVHADWHLLCELRAAVRALSDAAGAVAVRGSDSEARKSEVAAARLMWEEDAREGWDGEPISAARLFAELRRALPDETLIVDQCTTTAPYLRAHFPVPSGDLYMAASGSCQGWAAGAALGAKLAEPERPVLAVVGDGGLMFGVQALWSAVEHRIPVTFVVCDNGGWHSMRTSLARFSPQVRGSELGFGWETDYTGLARSMGVPATTASNPVELGEILAEHPHGQRPLLVHVRCRRERRLSGWMAADAEGVSPARVGADAGAESEMA